MRFFAILTGSFHSAALYRHVRAQGRFCLGYALLLVMGCTLLASVYFGTLLNHELFVARDGKPAMFDSIVTQIASQVPVMTYKDGRLMTKEPVASVISIGGEIFDEKFGDIAFITIDTTGATTHTSMQTPILITAEEFIYKDAKETKIQPLNKFFTDTPTMVINHAVVMDGAANIITATHRNLLKIFLVAGGFLWLFFAVFSYVLRVIMLLALGLGGVLIGTLIKSPLTFREAFGLAAVSFTPIALLETAILIIAGYPVHTITLFVAGLIALAAVIKISTPPPVMIG